MATAKELRQSRDGGTRGLFGIINQTTLHEVILDTATDDPVIALQTATTGAIPKGTRFPWSDVVAYAQEYTPFHTDAPRVYRVLVNYLPPIVADLSSTWFIEIETATEGKVVYQDRNGVPIGPRVYKNRPLDLSGDDLLNFNNDCVKHKFEPSIIFKARHPEKGELEYVATKDPIFGRRSLGATKLKRVGTLVLRKIVPNLTDNQLGRLVAANTALNSVTWFGGRAGTIQQRGCNARPSDGILNVTTRIPGIVWDVTLIYSWDEEGIEDETRTVDSIQNDDGSRAIITGDPGFTTLELAGPTSTGQAKTTMTAFRSATETTTVTQQPIYERIDFQGFIASVLGSAPTSIRSFTKP